MIADDANLNLNEKLNQIEVLIKDFDSVVSPAQISDNQLILTSKINEMENSIEELKEEIRILKKNSESNLLAVEWKFVGKDVDPYDLNSGEFTYTITLEEDNRLDLCMRKYDKYGKYWAWNMTRTTTLNSIVSIHDHDDAFVLQADAEEFRTLQGRGDNSNYYNQIVGRKSRAVKTLVVGQEYVIHIPGLTPQFVYAKTKNSQRAIEGQETLFPDNVEG